MTTTTLLSYGDVMTAARQRSGRTQESVAAELGISQSLVSAWEKGVREPNVSTFLRYMRVCKAEPAALTLVNPEIGAAGRILPAGKVTEPYRHGFPFLGDARITQPDIFAALAEAA